MSLTKAVCLGVFLRMQKVFGFLRDNLLEFILAAFLIAFIGVAAISIFATKTIAEVIEGHLFLITSDFSGTSSIIHSEKCPCRLGGNKP